MKKKSKKVPENQPLIWSYFVLIYGVVVFLMGSFLIILDSGTQSSQTSIYSDEIKEQGLLNFFSGGDPAISLLVIVSLLLIIIGLLFVLANRRAEKMIRNRTKTVHF